MKQENKKLIITAIAIFLCITVCLIGLDRLVFRPLFPAFFTYAGMSFDDLQEAMGSEYTSLGYGLFIPRWELPFGQSLTAVIIQDTVTELEISGFVDPSFVRFMLPVFIAMTAVADILITIRIQKRKK